MHCPSCGAHTTLDQKFCRSCGMDLETVSKLVAEHSSPETLKLEKSISKKDAQKRMYYSLMLGMISFILGMAVLVVVKTLELPKTVNMAGAFLLFLAMGLMTFAVLSPLRDGVRSLQRSSTPAVRESFPKLKPPKSCLPPVFPSPASPSRPLN